MHFDLADLLSNFHSSHHSTEHCVLVVQPWLGGRGEKEEGREKRKRRKRRRRRKMKEEEEKEREGGGEGARGDDVEHKEMEK